MCAKADANGCDKVLMGHLSFNASQFLFCVINQFYNRFIGSQEEVNWLSWRSFIFIMICFFGPFKNISLISIVKKK